MPTPWSALLIIPHQCLWAHGGGLEIPNPEFALSWQGKCLIRTHTPFLVTLPAFLAQHATLDLSVGGWCGGWGEGVSSICWMCCDVWAAVEMRDWFNKESVSEEGAAVQQQQQLPSHSSPKMALWSGSMLCCMGPLSAEHWVTHGSTSRGIKSTLPLSTCQTAAKAA